MLVLRKQLVAIGLTITLLLLIPLVAMQFTDEVNWTAFDFAVAGFLLLGTGLLGTLVTRRVTARKHRLALYGTLLITLLLVWVELAVGIFGTPLAGQ